MDIYLYRDGQQVGPFTREQLLTQVHCGTATTRDLAWHQGLENWISLGELLSETLWNEDDTPEAVEPDRTSLCWTTPTAALLFLVGIGGYLWLTQKRPAAPSAEVSLDQSSVPAASPFPTVAGAKPAQATVPRPVPSVPPSEAELLYAQARQLDLKKDATKDDIDNAVGLYRKSADQGNTLAMTALADLLRKQNYSRNKAEIQDLYSRAAKLGNPKGLIYVAADAKTAAEYVSLLSRAAAAGSVNACRLLRQFSEGKNYAAHKLTDKPEPNPALALQWELIAVYLDGHGTYGLVQRLKRQTSAADVQIAQQGADAFVQANHLKEGVWFENQAHRLMLLTKTQGAGDIPDHTPQAATEAPAAILPAPPSTADNVKQMRSTGNGAVSPLSLSKTWSYGSKNGSLTAVDLRNLLGKWGRANADLNPHPDLTIYKSVNYLMPVAGAIRTLNLGRTERSTNAVTCPGWPASSFRYYSFDGIFEGHYNRLLLVVDIADQVIAVELVDESPKNRAKYSGTASRWHTYDFVQTQCRLDSTCQITQDAKIDSNYKSLRIDSQFYGHNGWAEGGGSYYDTYGRPLSGMTSSFNAVLQQDVRLYLPQPIIDLILYNLQ